MYSKAERQKAVDLYIKYGKRASAVIRESGYPDRKTLACWYNEYEEQGWLHEAQRIQARAPPSSSPGSPDLIPALHPPWRGVA